MKEKVRSLKQERDALRIQLAAALRALAWIREKTTYILLRYHLPEGGNELREINHYLAKLLDESETTVPKF